MTAGNTTGTVRPACRKGPTVVAPCAIMTSGASVTKAGLPKHCRLHGLKKGGMRRLAEDGSTTHELMAVKRYYREHHEFLDEVPIDAALEIAAAQLAPGRVLQ
jgi:hypothetical protein